MSLLDSWAAGEHTHGTQTFPTYRKGTGPGVVLIHEIPGPTPQVISFAEEVVAAGYTVVMPHLFGVPEKPVGALYAVDSLRKVCVSHEFTAWGTGVTTPMAPWLRSLARDLHAELGGPGVGALGMCFTGGFALAMMVDPSVVAPVLAQPSAPFPVGDRRSRDVNLSPEDLAVVQERAAAGCPVLGLRFTGDLAVGKRFETLREALGDAFLPLELPGRQHATLTLHRQQVAVDRVLGFFAERLSPEPSA